MKVISTYQIYRKIKNINPYQDNFKDEVTYLRKEIENKKIMSSKDFMKKVNDLINYFHPNDNVVKNNFKIISKIK